MIYPSNERKCPRWLALKLKGEWKPVFTMVNLQHPLGWISYDCETHPWVGRTTLVVCSWGPRLSRKETVNEVVVFTCLTYDCGHNVAGC